jgi:hypothetical protein
MRNLRRVVAAGFAVGLALPSLAVAQKAKACGVERWAVKTLADEDSGLVRRGTLLESTVKLLGEIPIPEIPYPQTRRIAPQELTVYRIRAVVRQIITESDGDWHLVLADPKNPQWTMIGEIPSPECAATAAHRQLYTAARDSLRRVPRLGEVTIDGVGFFDFIHNQRGRARNAIELHPILRIAR